MTPYPILFQPILKQTIWGGRRLGEQLGKPIGEQADYAESWEVVDHGEDQSVAANGPLAGQSLAEITSRNRKWLLGDGASGLDSFPLLLKYLDCNRVLSVQVHPSDQYALKMPKPDLGKTEAWYIVAAEPGSLIYAGLKPGVDRQQLEQAIADGRAESVLHSFVPDPGDVVFIPAGTVHALGAGLLIAEIQQSSDTTFRLFDWNRVGADGNPRPLHLEQGLEVSDYLSGPVSPRRARAGVDGWQRLVECDKFVLQVIERGTAKVAGDGKFHILTVPRGQVTLQLRECQTVLTTGQTALIPAASDAHDITVSAGATLLGMHL